MKKVKIFESEILVGYLEEKINKFLENRTLHSLTTSTGGHNNNRLFVTIVYSENLSEEEREQFKDKMQN